MTAGPSLDQIGKNNETVHAANLSLSSHKGELRGRSARLLMTYLVVF